MWFRNELSSLAEVSLYWLPTPFASFPLHFPSSALPRAITFQLESTTAELPCLTPERYRTPRWGDSVLSRNLIPNSLGVTFPLPYSLAATAYCDSTSGGFRGSLPFLSPELFFFILAHPVYKMLIIQKPNTLELWNKLHFEEKNTESIYHV